MPTTAPQALLLLQAIEWMLATPAAIRQHVRNRKERYRNSHRHPISDTALTDHVADQLIAAYSKAGWSGGATALIGLVPGVDSAVELWGGATADLALCLKYQVEMSMALADLYGHDIETEADRKRHLIIAGLSTLNLEAFKQGSEQATRAFTHLVQHYLREATQDTVPILFRKVSIKLSKRALQKTIPFGIGAVIGFSSNKALTWLVGQRVKAFLPVPPALYPETFQNRFYACPPKAFSFSLRAVSSAFCKQSATNADSSCTVPGGIHSIKKASSGRSWALL